jgi:hypothetical protein
MPYGSDRLNKPHMLSTASTGLPNKTNAVNRIKNGQEEYLPALQLSPWYLSMNPGASDENKRTTLMLDIPAYVLLTQDAHNLPLNPYN